MVRLSLLFSRTQEQEESYAYFLIFLTHVQLSCITAQNAVLHFALLDVRQH
jgi:hypothetical protein